MLFSLGHQTRTGDVVDLLLTCHRRVLEHLALARRIADAPSITSTHSIAAAAGRVRRYFADAFPLHRLDEELDIFPRLLGRDDELDAAIGELVRDHEEHEANVAAIVSLCEVLEGSPERLRELAAQLGKHVQSLEIELGAHIALEERTVFPAIGRMAAHERQTILDRMRTRREHSLAS